MKPIDTFVFGINIVCLNKAEPGDSLSPLPFGFVFAEGGILAPHSDIATTNVPNKN